MNRLSVTSLDDFRDKYRKKQVLSSDVAGRHAQIWQCEDKATSQTRSMKVLPKKKFTYLQFLQEVTILKECNAHPNLLDLLDVYECPKYYYIVTDNMDHPTVLESLTSLKNVDQDGQETILTILQTLVGSLQYLHDPDAASKVHKKEIVHGNINAKTILVPEGKAETANFLVVDFSEACMDMEIDMDLVLGDIDTDSSDSDISIDEEDEEDDLQQVQSNQQKKRRRRKKISRFDPPEINKTGPTAKGDIFSLGVLTFLLLTGHYPFRRPSEVKTGVQNWYGIKNPKIQKIIQRLLQFHPEGRPVAEAINRTIDWRTSFDGYEDDLKDVMGRLTSINQEYEFKRAVRSYIAANLLQESNQERLSQVFRLADTNNDNTLSKKELKNALEEAGMHVTPKDLDSYFWLLDSNNDNQISYTEFVAFAAKQEVLFEKEKLRAAFDAFDFSSTGYITAEDLRKFSTTVGGASSFRGEKVLKKRTIQAMMEEADKNCDGMVSFDEFTDVILRTPYFAVFKW